MRDKRIVFIFDECHRSQFGDNHDAIRDFFPKAQLFGFTGTPIFEENATYIKIKDGKEASYKITEDIFDECLHEYTISHAIDDKNVLRFRMDYFKADKDCRAENEQIRKQAIIKQIIDNHDTSTNNRQFNAFFATNRIDDAIAFYQGLKKAQDNIKQQDPDYQPLNIACVFSPPSKLIDDPKAKQDNLQLAEDLEQELEDNNHNPKEKKKALESIISDYNTQYNTNYNINDFDAYYQDIQQRIKDQQYPNKDYPHTKKIDITIVVDMLLTGFDSKYLNTLYVDKTLNYHRMIQAYSRTNRVLNDTKPQGNILDFRYQEHALNQAIARFSSHDGHSEGTREIWLVDDAPTVIGKLEHAVNEFKTFMKNNALDGTPNDIVNLKGDNARIQFIQKFREIQQYQTQLDQYTDLSNDQQQQRKKIISDDDMQIFKAHYIETAHQLRQRQQGNDGGNGDIDAKTREELEQLDFAFILFASSIIDYDYIMDLLSKYTYSQPEKREVNRQQLFNLIMSDAKFIDERDDLKAYIDTLPFDEKLTKEQIIEGYENFKAQKHQHKLTEIAHRYGLQYQALQGFIDHVMYRMIFDDSDLTDLMLPLGYGWKERTQQKILLMRELMPIFLKLADGRKISGLSVYDEI